MERKEAIRWRQFEDSIPLLVSELERFCAG